MEGKFFQRAKVNLFLVLLTTLISVTGATAQTHFSGKFTLSHQVYWGQAIFPAGNYSINTTSIHSVALVQSDNGKISRFVTAAMTSANEKGQADLVIMAQGRERRVVSVNLPAAGIFLLYSPLTNTERETLATTNNLESVSVVVQKK